MIMESGIAGVLMTEFLDEKSGLSIVFTKNVVAELLKYKQTAWKCEAGGMLFCPDLFSGKIVISRISQPHKKDFRCRLFFRHNSKYAQRKINEMFNEGFHYIGDWHTHPQLSPCPSGKDIATIKSIFDKSDHDLNYMVHVIVPSVDNFENSYVALTDGKNVLACRPVL